MSEPFPLALFFAPEEKDRVKAAESLLYYAVEEPTNLINLLPQLHLCIQNQLSFPEPKWYITSLITFAIYLALNSVSSLPEDKIVELIHISKTITDRFLHYTTYFPKHMPFFSPMIETFESKHFINKDNISLPILLAYADHCSIGFIHKMSFTLSFINVLSELYKIIKSADPSYFPKLAEPLASPDRVAAGVFLGAWTQTMACYLNEKKDFSSLPPIYNLIELYSSDILNFISEGQMKGPKPSDSLALCAKFLLRAPLASPKKREKYLNLANDSLFNKLAPTLKIEMKHNLDLETQILNSFNENTVKNPESLSNYAVIQIKAIRSIKKVLSVQLIEGYMTYVKAINLLMFSNSPSTFKSKESTYFGELNSKIISLAEDKGKFTITIQSPEKNKAFDTFLVNAEKDVLAKLLIDDLKELENSKNIA